MRVVIYNTNSFGGNYNYSIELARAYRSRKDVENCVVLSPPSRNTTEPQNTGSFLLPDESPYLNGFIRKLYFLIRSFVNPFRLYRFLKNYPDAILLFNDYDQVSAPVWVPFFKTLKKRHILSVILHDPDRDRYFPNKKLSVWTMTKFMTIIDVAFYHELLPDKSYFNKVGTKVKVPHGIYIYPDTDLQFLATIKANSRGKYVISILGNVRTEKNYELAINALQSLPDVMLLVAGAAANSRISIQKYQDQISESGVSQQVLWVDKFLSDAELQAAINASDMLLMCYKPGFTSQSGILNLIAPYHKNIIVGDSPSALQKTVEDFSLGQIIPLTTQALVNAVNDTRENSRQYHAGWERYIKYASWESHADISLSILKIKQTEIQ